MSAPYSKARILIKNTGFFIALISPLFNRSLILRPRCIANVDTSRFSISVFIPA